MKVPRLFARGAIRLRGADPEFDSLEESFLMRVFDLDREARFYETMLVAMAAMGIDGEKIQEFIKEYSKLIWPEVDQDDRSRQEVALEKFSRFAGKPFNVLPTEGGTRGTLLRDSPEKKE